MWTCSHNRRTKSSTASREVSALESCGFLIRRAKWPIGHMKNRNEALDTKVDGKPSICVETGRRLNLCGPGIPVSSLDSPQLLDSDTTKHEVVFHFCNGAVTEARHVCTTLLSHSPRLIEIKRLT